MKYLIEITQRQFEEIKRLISQDKYLDLAQFIDAAVENQLHIEKSDPAQEYRPLGAQVMADNIASFKSDKAESPKVFVPQPADKHCLGLVSLPRDTKTVEPPSDADLRFIFPEAGPEKNWLWGQVNRIFPIKIGIRYLAAALGENQTIDLNAFREMNLRCPALIEERLRNYEMNKGIDRDKCISTGLPGAAANDFKSHERYRNQFLAVYRKDGKLDGALPLHKFVNVVVENGKPRIGITKAGLDFALLENPVLDREDFSVSLSDAEKAFYITHMRNCMPGEYAGIKWVLSEIKEGKSRDEINSDMAAHFGQAWNSPSAEFITTQRAGMIARVSELGLITKEKTGVKVKYLIAEKGLELLAL